MEENNDISTEIKNDKGVYNRTICFALLCITSCVLAYSPLKIDDVISIVQWLSGSYGTYAIAKQLKK